MSNPLVKAERSAFKDKRQMGVDDRQRRGKKKGQKKPFVVVAVLKEGVAHWSTKPGKKEYISRHTTSGQAIQAMAAHGSRPHYQKFDLFIEKNGVLYE